MTKLLVSDEFYDSWQYIPLLVLATAFSVWSIFWAAFTWSKRKACSPW